MPPAVRQVGLWGPVAACMAVIFFFSSLPAPPGAASVPDWASHGGIYAALSALLCRALGGGIRPIPARTAVLAAALASAYGLTDEWHQTFVPGRVAEVADLVKDLAGAVLGAVLFFALAPRWAAAPVPR